MRLPERWSGRRRQTRRQLDAVRRLARANRCSVADVLRLGTLHLAAHLEENGGPPIMLGGDVMIVEPPDPSVVELLPGVNRDGL